MLASSQRHFVALMKASHVAGALTGKSASVFALSSQSPAIVCRPQHVNFSRSINSCTFEQYASEKQHCGDPVTTTSAPSERAAQATAADDCLLLQQYHEITQTLTNLFESTLPSYFSSAELPEPKLFQSFGAAVQAARTAHENSITQPTSQYRVQLDFSRIDSETLEKQTFQLFVQRAKVLLALRRPWQAYLDIDKALLLHYRLAKELGESETTQFFEIEELLSGDETHLRKALEPMLRLDPLALVDALSTLLSLTYSLQIPTTRDFVAPALEFASKAAGLATVPSVPVTAYTLGDLSLNLASLQQEIELTDEQESQLLQKLLKSALCSLAEIRRVPEMGGYGMFATKVIKKGEYICHFDPITAVVRNAGEAAVCAHCLRGLAKVSAAGKQISKGDILFVEIYEQLFCSESCMHEAHKKWNNTLYSIWPGYKSILALGSDRDARRDSQTDFFLSQISVMRMSSADMLAATLQLYSLERSKSKEAAEALQASKLFSRHALRDLQEHYLKVSSVNPDTSLYFFVYLVNNMMKLLNNVPTLSRDPNFGLCEFARCAWLVERYQFGERKKSIPEKDESSSSEEYQSDYDSGMDVATVQKLASLFNHSCEPNVEFIGPKGVVQAKKNIKPGEQLFVSYVDERKPHKERAARLKFLYKFDCSCPKCVKQHKPSRVTKSSTK